MTKLKKFMYLLKYGENYKEVIDLDHSMDSFYKIIQKQDDNSIDELKALHKHCKKEYVILHLSLIVSWICVLMNIAIGLYNLSLGGYGYIVFFINWMAAGYCFFKITRKDK